MSGKTKQRPIVFGYEPDQNEINQIKLLFLEIEEGFNKKDVDVIDRKLAADSIMIAPDGAAVEGFHEIYSYHKMRLGGPASQWETAFSILSVKFFDDKKAVVYTEQKTITPENTIVNHAISLLVKANDIWWISSMQSTNVMK